MLAFNKCTELYLGKEVISEYLFDGSQGFHFDRECVCEREIKKGGSSLCPKNTHVATGLTKQIHILSLSHINYIYA